jgi:hypothetical protein
LNFFVTYQLTLISSLTRIPYCRRRFSLYYFLNSDDFSTTTKLSISNELPKETMPSVLPTHSPDSPLASLDPSLFDIIPNLHDLVSRLTHSSTSTTSQTPLHDAQKLLTPKEFTQEVAKLKEKLKKAAAAVGGLPDIDRTVEEQEHEIRELEGSIGEQRRVLREWKER